MCIFLIELKYLIRKFSRGNVELVEGFGVNGKGKIIRLNSNGERKKKEKKIEKCGMKKYKNK